MKTVSPSIAAQQTSLNPEEFLVFLSLYVEDPQGQPLHLHLTNGVTQEWRGQLWTNAPFRLSGVSQKSSGELSRPQLSLPNTNSAFSYYIAQGLLEDSEVEYFKVLPSELLAGTYERSVYYVAQIRNLQSQLINLELRRPSDGNAARLPLRRFVQPEFATVIL